MRIFQDLDEACVEIKRDLSKSPSVASSRVQGKEVKALAREAIGYAYTVVQMPDWPGGLAAVAAKHGFLENEGRSSWLKWLATEEQLRGSWVAGASAEDWHPMLKTQMEGQEPSYVYQDRLRGLVEVMAGTLSLYPDTRRAYWPMFNLEDANRAARLTRIPCTIGYQFMIREVATGDSRLHCVYLERSCDFDRFWISDLWLANRLQARVLSELKAKLPEDESIQRLKLGHTTHMITSFHSFYQVQGEIY